MTLDLHARSQCVCLFPRLTLEANSKHICMLEILLLAAGVERGVGY